MNTIHNYDSWIIVHPDFNFLTCGSLAHKFYFHFGKKGTYQKQIETFRQELNTMRESGRFGAIFHYGDEWPIISGFDSLDNVEQAIARLQNTDYGAAYASCPWFPFEFESEGDTP